MINRRFEIAHAVLICQHVVVIMQRNKLSQIMMLGAIFMQWRAVLVGLGNTFDFWLGNHLGIIVPESQGNNLK